MDFSKLLFRCSQLGNLMTDPRSKKDKESGELSETTKVHLLDVLVQNKYDRRTDISNKYTMKGLMVEEDAITLYSRVKKEMYLKNEEHLSNDYIKGTPDLFTGESIKAANIIIDIKSSWDIFTFFRNITKGLPDMYYWQLQGYMALTGAKNGVIAFCLVDTPETFIDDAKRRLMWSMNAGTTENPDYIEAAALIDKSMIFSDIPMTERVIEFEIDYDADGIEKLYSRIDKSRLYMKELNSKISKT